MECFCEQKETYELKVEGDVGADPIWCNQCGCNLDIDDLPISDTLTNELIEWVNKYGEWIDWDEDKLLPNGIELEEEHNKQGLTLTEKQRKNLKGNIELNFHLRQWQECMHIKIINPYFTELSLRQLFLHATIKGWGVHEGQMEVYIEINEVRA